MIAKLASIAGHYATENASLEYWDQGQLQEGYLRLQNTLLVHYDNDIFPSCDILQFNEHAAFYSSLPKESGFTD